MKNYNLLLVDKYKENESPIIGAIISEDGISINSKIENALSDYFNCSVKNLKIDINETSDIFNGIFTMVNDKEEIEMDFEIYKLECY